MVKKKKVKKLHDGKQFSYPWEQWLIRKSRKVLSNKDFSAKQSSMCVMIRQNARRLGVSVSVIPRSNGSIEIIPKG